MNAYLWTVLRTSAYVHVWVGEDVVTSESLCVLTDGDMWPAVTEDGVVGIVFAENRRLYPYAGEMT